MLTDDEKRSLIEQYTFGKEVNALALVAEVERAVLAKAGEQEPAFAFMGGYSMIDGKKYYDLTVNYKFKDNLPKGNFYAHPLPAQAIPEGWKLVPVEPTVDMDDEYARASGQHHLSLRGYKAMLSASPKP